MLKHTAVILALLSPLHAEEVVGQIGSVQLPTSEVKALIKTLEENSETPASLTPEALDQFVRALLVQRLVLKKADSEKYSEKPEVVAELKRTQQSAIVESYLKSVSKPAADYPSDTELSEIYENNKESFLVPKSYNLAQVFVANPAEGSGEEAKKRLDSVLAQLKEPSSDFASIARVSSDDRNSAPNGGNLGWLQENLIQKGISEALPTMKVGEVSKAIKLDDGWHIVKLLDVREANTPTLSQLKPQLKARLRAQKAQENRQQYLSELLLENPPAINGIELNKLITAPR